MKKLDFLKRLSLYTFLALGIIFTGCKDDDDAPAEENNPEVITDVKLIFTPTDGGAAVEASAKDPDGEGVQGLVVSGSIDLEAGKTYTLTYEVFNNLDPDNPEDVLTDDISKELDEHQVFYSFTDGAFTDPSGDGNIDTASDPINYNDKDGNDNPVGFNTTWTTSATARTGDSFTAKLQHQPGVKTATSGATDGDTDFDLTFVLNIQ